MLGLLQVTYMGFFRTHELPQLNKSNFLDKMFVCFITVDVLPNTSLSWDPYHTLQDIFGEISVEILLGFLGKE